MLLTGNVAGGAEAKLRHYGLWDFFGAGGAFSVEGSRPPGDRPPRARAGRRARRRGAARRAHGRDRRHAARRPLRQGDRRAHGRRGHRAGLRRSRSWRRASRGRRWRSCPSRPSSSGCWASTVAERQTRGSGRDSAPMPKWWSRRSGDGRRRRGRHGPRPSGGKLDKARAQRARALLPRPAGPSRRRRLRRAPAGLERLDRPLPGPDRPLRRRRRRDRGRRASRAATGLPIAVRGGGHSFPGLSVCDGGVVIDLGLMKGIHVDPETRTARVEAGVLWGELDRATQAYGLAVTGGIVTHTGVAGLTLGGGIGWLQRKHGLTIDNLIAADVVTVGGDFVRASETRAPRPLLGAARRRRQLRRRHRVRVPAPPRRPDRARRADLLADRGVAASCCASTATGSPTRRTS